MDAAEKCLQLLLIGNSDMCQVEQFEIRKKQLGSIQSVTAAKCKRTKSIMRNIENASLEISKQMRIRFLMGHNPQSAV